MKKIIAFLLCVSLCICFSSCAKQNNVDESKNTEAVLTTKESFNEQQVSTTENFEQTATTKENTAENVTTTLSDKVEENSTTVKSSKTASTKESTTKNNVTSTTQKSNTEKATTEKESVKPSSTTAQPPKEISCTVKIECTKILENKNKFTDDISLVPSNGVILSTVTVKAKDGATAYDVIKKACSQNSITLNEKDSMFGKYIVGFNGIDEKDCGSQSGWLYSVNGKMPSVSVSSYKVTNGDNIVLSYTC